jgi:hypothetical protein
MRLSIHTQLDSLWTLIKREQDMECRITISHLSAKSSRTMLPLNQVASNIYSSSCRSSPRRRSSFQSLNCCFHASRLMVFLSNHFFVSGGSRKHSLARYLYSRSGCLISLTYQKGSIKWRNRSENSGTTATMASRTFWNSEEEASPLEMMKRKSSGLVWQYWLSRICSSRRF